MLDTLPSRLARRAALGGALRGLALLVAGAPALSQSFPGQRLLPPNATADGQCSCTAVSGNGQVVAISGPQSRFWTAEAGLTPIAGPVPIVYGFNTDGTVAVGSTGDWYFSQDRAVRWTPSSGAVSLIPVGGITSAARAVSSDGTVVVGWLRTSWGNNLGSRIPFRWTASGGTQLLAANGEARDVSADGRYTVGMIFGSNASAVVWDALGGATVIQPTTPGHSVTPLQISADGSTVVGEVRPSGGVGSPFIWTAANGMTVLPPYSSAYVSCVDGLGTTFGIVQGGASRRHSLSGSSVQLAPLAGSSLSMVQAMSDDGRVLVGHSNSLSNNIGFATIWIDGVPQVLCPQTVHPACAPVPALTGTFRLGGGQACTFQLDQAPSFSAGVFFLGLGFDAQVLSPFGVVCAPPPFLRFVPTTQHTGGTCGTSFSVNLNQLARSGAIPGLVPGRQLVGQFWYRDASAPGGAAMSVAVRCILSL